MRFKSSRIKKLITASVALLGSVALNGHAATATFDPASGIVNLPVVEVLSGSTSSFYSAQ